MGLLLGLLLGAVAVGSHAAEPSPPSPEELRQAFPEADRIGASIGTPPSAPAYRDGRQIGYVLSTWQTVGSIGYSGKPIDVLVGLDNDGVIRGIRLHRHSEPILVIGVADADLARYIQDFVGIDVRAVAIEAGRAALPDPVARATISSEVIEDAVLGAARAVARGRGILGGGGGARLDRESFEPAGWAALVRDGSVRGLTVRRADAAELFDQAGPPDDVMVELELALLTPPRIGRNLLGSIGHNKIAAQLGPGDQAILVAGNGLYSFKGTAYRRTGQFDRIQIAQADRTILLTEEGYANVTELEAADAPEFREIGRFIVPGETGFDPLRPWRLDLMVERPTLDGGMIARTFSVEYELPHRYVVEAPAGAALAAGERIDDRAPLWQRTWRERIPQIAGLAAMLLGLSVVLVFQDTIVRDYRRYRVVRLGYLGLTLIWLGWIVGAQLSVVHVLTFAHALMGGDFEWTFFLLDPMAFILWSYVALTLLFWGRGVFCGWLCPFGALQELLNEGARRLRVPQIKVPFGVHERLWPIKYILFLGLFAVSLHSVTLAMRGAEIEPFKTAISLGFQRAWPFVAYAAAVLVAGLFIERFFCRYLCPLGAALAIPARLRMFDWLKRHHECGRECAICANRCTVQAIHPNGAINPNECIHCLECQTLYYDTRLCPPMVAKRKRRERRLALSSASEEQLR